MTIILKNKATLSFDDFSFRCCIGKRGLSSKKIEGDKKTPTGEFSLGNLYYRKDRIVKPTTKLKCIKIRKNMGWCDDIRDNKYYNKLFKINRKVKHEKIYRKDYKYDLMIPINYNTKNTKLGKGSAIFLHLTKNYQSTNGCVALGKKDFLILIKLIKKNTKIKLI
ncbi:L,D-transpeptidase family protein [Pelagibacterales bacterium SAG-MED23]|nr:L,D-transpeptidase family protein [Pelagibacterales bacterium SAG-MED23]|tara:strand:+ start:32 stop:526 length:495 start_codon:yes stop_codon:yes gene_type:complete